MRSKFPVGFRAWGAAFALCCATLAHAAEQHPLMGAAREQVLSRYGEPRSTLVHGDRELLFYPRERLTLRDGIVVEVERLAVSDTTKRAAAPTEPPTGQPTTPAPTETPATPPATSTPANSSPSTESSAPETAQPAPPAAPESRVEIKRVLPPGTSTTRPAPKQETVETTPPPAAKNVPVEKAGPTVGATKSATPPPASSSSAPGASSASPTASSTAPNQTPSAAAATTPGVPPATPGGAATTPAESEPAEAAKAEDSAAAKKAKREADVKAARRRLEQAEADAINPAAAAFTTRTYVIALLIIGGGIGYLFWRRRQRQIEMAATAVSRTPFSTPVATGMGAVFTVDLLAKLEWKRFEELVAAYYSKTGVVASRTKGGPAAPVHIKISWKGEPRPFALVQCIAQPIGLIDAKPIQDLHSVLAAEDIRRGYVITTGKFNVPARDFAEEKHITLLPGDIFVEKLNALPDAARNELMQQVTSGDYSTPSCPKCDMKMVRSPLDPGMWQCAAHPEQQIATRK